jgi:polar amino acid transport system substrate-binding protein
MMKEPGMRNVKLILVSILSFTCAAALPLTGFAQTALPLTGFVQTLEHIQSTGTFRIGFVPDEAPFSTADGTGYSIELCQMVAENLRSRPGMSKLKVETTSTSLEAGLGLVEQGGVDILCGAASDTLARRERVSFSLPIYNGGTGVVVRKDAPADLLRVLEGKVAHEGPVWRSTINRGLAEHTYAVHAGTVTEAWVREQIATLGVIATVVPVKEHAEGVDMVAQKKADAYFGDRSIISGVLSTRSDSDEMMLLQRYFTYEPIALAIARNNDDFRLIVDTVLSELYLSDEFAAMYAKYFGQPGDRTVELFKIYARH